MKDKRYIKSFNEHGENLNSELSKAKSINMAKTLNGINFWSSGKKAAIIDKDDKVLVSFDTVFINHEWSPEIKSAMAKFGFDPLKQRILTNDTLQDAIYTLNVSRLISKLPLTVSKEELDNYIKQKLHGHS